MTKTLQAATFLFFSAVLAFGQSATSLMTGTVTDPTGAAVPAAQVEVVQTDTSLILKAVTDDQGVFALPSVPAGPYRITVSKPGFKTATVSDVQVQSGVPARVPIKLEIGQATETVTVAAGAEIVQTTSAEVSSTLTNRQVTDLPFATRNAVELMVTQAGTATPTNPRSSTINGLPKGALNITIDGMNSQDNMLKSSDGFFSYIMPSVDSLEEVTLTTSAAGVDSTAQGAAQIKFVTRSGTNNYHGGAFYQVRNTALDANYYFNNENKLPRDIVHLRQYGAHIGGPILKNKLFFFGDAELYRLPGTKAYSRTILTDDARNGIYTYKDTSGTVRQVNLYNLVASATVPNGVRPYATTPDPILASTFAQIAKLSANGVVKSNSVTSNDYNTNTLSYQPTGLDKRNFYTGRIDYNLTLKHRLSLVYDYDFYGGFSDFLNNVVPYYPGTGAVLGNDSPVGQSSNRFAGTLSWRATLSPNLTNELRGGINGGTVLFFGQISPGMFSTWKGYNPSFGSGLSGVTATTNPQRRNAPVKDVSDTLSWVKGRHQLSFGGNFDNVGVFQEIANTAQFPGISFGIATNDPIATGSTNLFAAGNFPGATASQLSAAAGLYATLTGRVSSISRNLVLDENSHQYQSGIAPIDRDHLREYGLFAQDVWRIAPTLTLTLGLRYEKQFAFQNVDGTYSQVTYAAAWGLSGIGHLYAPGVLTGIAPTYTKLDPSNTYKIPGLPAPSVGLAWQLPAHEGALGWLFGKTTGSSVLRMGYAIATVREGMNVYTGTYGSNQGLNFSASVDPTNFPQDFGAPGSVLFRDPTLPVRSGLPTSPQYPITPTFSNALYAFDPNLKMGYVQSWNISFQRALSRNMVLDLRYTGNHEVRGWRVYSLNETNIVENGFFNEFQVAANNLAIARATPAGSVSGASTGPNSVNFGNQGLPGQKALTILPIALGTTCCSDTTTANNLALGQAGTLAQNIATNATRMASLQAAGYPINFFKVNGTVGGGSANVVTNNGSSFYDAFTAELNRRMSAGLLIQGSYTFAKALANGATASGTDSSTPFTFRNLALSKQPESFDIRNAIKINSLYELPIGPGRAYFGSVSNKFARKALEGWELSGVARLQSGTPMFFSGFNQFNQNGAGVVLHNITPGQFQSLVGVYKTTAANGQGIVYYLPPPVAGAAAGDNIITNTQAAFQQGNLTPAQVDPTKPYIGPAPAGQLGWNGLFYLPWQRHFDLAMTKRTRIGEHANVEFRAQALNVFNITNFLPNNNIGTSFGQITTAYQDLSGTVDPGGRILEFILRVNF